MSASGQPVAFTIVLSSSEYSTTLDTALLLPGLVPTRHAAHTASSGCAELKQQLPVPWQ